MIPKVLHRVVRQTTSEEEERFWSEFARLHPGWELKTWRQPHDPSAWELGYLHARCGSGAQIADLVRLEALWRFGGVYVDSDCEPIRPFDPLLDASLFIGTEDGAHLSTGVIGAEPGHPGVRQYIDAIVEEDRVTLDVPPNESTGPFLATEILGSRADVTVLPPEFFYPYPPGAPRPASVADVATPFTYVAHHGAGSWVTPSPAPGMMARARGVARHGKSLARRTVAASATRWERSKPPVIANASPGTYLGNNRMLVRLPHGLSITALADDRSITPELAAHGMYDWPFWRFIERTVRAGDHVIDVGANIGLFTLGLAARVGRFGRVHAYEPDEELCDIVEDNLRLNWMADRVEIHPLAASDRAGELTFCSDAAFRMLGSALPAGEHDEADGRRVKAERLDDRFDGRLPIRLVKVDVEGGEHSVLAGMARLLEKKAVQYVDVEVIRRNSGANWNSLTTLMRSFVTDHGASTYTISHDGSLAEQSLDRIIATAGHHPHVVFRFR